MIDSLGIIDMAALEEITGLCNKFNEDIDLGHQIDRLVENNSFLIQSNDLPDSAEFSTETTENHIPFNE